jgi:hypothetical protein
MPVALAAALSGSEVSAVSEPKSFASLSSTLLARKGEAKPAMRSQAINLSHTVARNVSDVDDDDHHDDLGWNDMGHDHEEHQNPPIMPSPINGHVSPQIDNIAPPPVIQQQAELAREFAPPPVVEAPVAAVAPAVVEATPANAPRAAAGTKGKAAFTLRLDGERHLKLRLVCAVNHRSAQQIVTQALDEFLARQPSVAELVRRGSGTPD